MSDNPQELMQRLAQDSPAMQEAMRTPPPNSDSVKQMPELDRLGLDLFRGHMTENAFNTFLTLVHWSVLMQKLSDGEQVEWTDETFAAMHGTWVGFGNPFLWESTYKTNIAEFMGLFHFNWHSKGPRYRRENPLPHKVIQELAGAFANPSRGYQHAKAVQDLVEDPSTYKGL